MSSDSYGSENYSSVDEENYDSYPSASSNLDSDSDSGFLSDSFDVDDVPPPPSAKKKVVKKKLSSDEEELSPPPSAKKKSAKKVVKKKLSSDEEELSPPPSPKKKSAKKSVSSPKEEVKLPLKKKKVVKKEEVSPPPSPKKEKAPSKKTKKDDSDEEDILFPDSVQTEYPGKTPIDQKLYNAYLNIINDIYKEVKQPESLAVCAVNSKKYKNKWPEHIQSKIDKIEEKYSEENEQSSS